MTQNEKWQKHYNEVMSYMLRFKRRPSKHRIDDHLMLNWIKYNKKKMVRGKMPEERIAQFNKLMEVAERYRKVNQSAYANNLFS